jgi:cell division protein FtsW
MIMENIQRRRPADGHRPGGSKNGRPASPRELAQARRRRIKPPSENAKGVRERLAKFDIPLFIIVLVLCVFGLGMLLSASYVFAAIEHDGDNFWFFNRQLGFMAVGLGFMLAISFFNYRILMNGKVVLILTLVSVGLMLAVMLVGEVQGGANTGAQRWLTIGPITFQPSEIMKFTLMVLLAYVANKNPERMKSFFKGFVPYIVIIAIACGLIVIQRHLSGTIIMFALGLTMMTVSNIRLPYVIVAILLMAIAGYFGLQVMESMGWDYFEDRLLSWRDPEADITGDTFQTFQSLVAIGSGGWFGLGLGNSRQKFSYLPAMHNDFIFSITVEELGFAGGCLVLLLFGIFILRGFYIATHTRDRFGMMLAVGITAQIGIQAFLNIAVATNSVPNTGISLPFFSYGGTALMMQLAQIGVLLNISRKASID